VHWHTGHILFFLHTPAGQVYFLNSSWTGHKHFFSRLNKQNYSDIMFILLHVLTGQLVFFSWLNSWLAP
jgi:hypothetical protein